MQSRSPTLQGLPAPIPPRPDERQPAWALHAARVRNASLESENVTLRSRIIELEHLLSIGASPHGKEAIRD